MEQEDPVRRRRWRPGSTWSRYWITIDQRGFHIHPEAVGVGGPFSSLSDAWAWLAAETEFVREGSWPWVSRTHRLFEEEEEDEMGFSPSTTNWRIYDDYFRPPYAPEHTRIEPMQQETFIQLTPR
jgi:hypothetical protein